MICLIALFVFAILGIFSAKYRSLAKEAFNCVFRRLTLRKCETGFDKKMKAGIVSKLMNRSPRAAKAINKHFELISWFFTITLFLSLFYTGQGIYNYAAYGNCNGKQGGFCIFNALSDQKDTIALSEIPLDIFPATGPENASVRLVEFGCFQCPYTKAAEPAVKGILEKYPGHVKLTFVYAPVPHHYNAVHAAEAAVCAANQGKFWQYHDLLFQNQNSFGNNVTPQDALAVFRSLAEKTGLNMTGFESCINSGKASGEVQQSVDYASRIGITGTPTFYINGKKLSGVVLESDIEAAIANNH